MPDPTSNITGEVVVITGASSGLGDATARHLSAQVEALVDTAVDGYGRVVRRRAPCRKGNAVYAAAKTAVRVPAESFARTVAFAISQPDDVDINEILFRPTRQEV